MRRSGKVDETVGVSAIDFVSKDFWVRRFGAGERKADGVESAGW
jgi:hypothetical protein